ncbi:MAG TPA: DNA topoisomerase III [Ruminococcus sp.]|nr:DNA topoisomerase III [Ruminococcus sp.]
MKLVIAEKPSVAQTIAKVIGASKRADGYLEGSGYIVSWCIGHLISLANPEMYDEKYKVWSFDNLPVIPDSWKFRILSSTEKQFLILKKLMLSDDVDEIICATDAGREGECIFRYVYSCTGCRKPFRRLWISSMEDKIIREGFDNLRNSNDYDNLYSAGFARAKADWLVGMNASRLFSVRYGSPLHIGRVSTPTLAMIVKRDDDIQNFVSRKYFTVIIDCRTFKAESERIDDEIKAKSIADMCNGKNAVAAGIKKEIKTVRPPELFDITSLQREANRLYGYTAKQTLDYTQSLYESKLVTYPRTDSRYVTDGMKDTLEEAVRLAAGILDFETENIDIQHCINNKKVSDHHAIIVTPDIKNKDTAELPEGEKNILMLIASKIVLAALEPYKYENIKVTIECENNLFYASGKSVLNYGWKSAETKFQENSEKTLPEISENQVFEMISSEKAEHWTAPPKRYTEDTLLSAMETAGNSDYDNPETEKKGLGTPATRAGIIENLVKHEYIKRDKKNIIAAEKGINLINAVPDEVKSAKLTADWEMFLQDIEKGRKNSDEFLKDIEDFIGNIVSKYSEKADASLFSSDRIPLGKCPRCGKNIYEGRNNYYCEGGCGFSLWKEFKIPDTVLSAKQVVELLASGKVKLNAVSKDKRKYTAFFAIEDTGKYINLKMIHEEKVYAGKCIRCGKNIYEGEKGYYCESGRNGCGFILWKNQRYPETVIKLKNAKELLSDKKISRISYKDKSGNTEKADFRIKDTGKYINLEFAE